MKTIDKTMLIREVLELDPGTARIMMQFGLHCLGCPHSQVESLEEASAVHGVSADEMVAQLNAYIAEQNAQ